VLPFKPLSAKLQALLNGGLNDIVKSLVVLEQDFAIDLNQGQLNEGQNIDKSDIIPEYSRTTISIKKSKNQISDRVTLRDTGDFYKSFKLKAENDSFSISATDSKTNKLQKKYGTKILGLSEESKAIFARHGLKIQLMKLIKQKIVQ